MSAEQEVRAALARAHLDPHPEEIPLLVEIYESLRAQMDRLEAIPDADQLPPDLGLTRPGKPD